MSGLPLLGIALMAISALFLLPADATTRFRLLQERLTVGVLVVLVVSALLSLAGSAITNAVMQTYDYHSCAVKHGPRMTFVTWAAQEVTCPREEVDRCTANAPANWNKA